MNKILKLGQLTVGFQSCLKRKIIRQFEETIHKCFCVQIGYRNFLLLLYNLISTVRNRLMDQLSIYLKIVFVINVRRQNPNIICSVMISCNLYYSQPDYFSTSIVFSFTYSSEDMIHQDFKSFYSEFVTNSSEAFMQT